MHIGDGEYNAFFRRRRKSIETLSRGAENLVLEHLRKILANSFKQIKDDGYIAAMFYWQSLRASPVPSKLRFSCWQI